MAGMTDLSMEAFVAQIGSKLVIAQVLILKRDHGFELRHKEDHDLEPDQLETIALSGARSLAQFTETGAFRPLKSAPNLRKGWRILVAGIEELSQVLSSLYPGAVADWFSVRERKAAPTGYREFTNRQTGMYRVTQLLSDADAGLVTRACCHADFCLKQRLWTVPGLASDLAEAKSIIPCREPCALLLEFARVTARQQQAETMNLPLRRGEAPEPPLEKAESEIREADFESPRNLRRLRLAAEKAQASICSQTNKS